METKMAAVDGGCNGALCAAERRLIKKELLSWTKKVPVLVGLEAIAEALAGQQRVRQLTRDGSAVDSVEGDPADWNAFDPCCICFGNTTISGMLPDSKYWNGSGKNEGGLDIFGSDHNLFDSFAGKYSDDLEFDLPLDLRRLPHVTGDERSFEVDSILGKPLVELRVPRVFQKSGKNSGSSSVSSSRRSYTEQALAEATSDICSGKIGTRRASMLYGIPRSTLRNKIFRLKTDSFTGDDLVSVAQGQSINHHHHHHLDAASFQGKIKTECLPMDCDEDDDDEDVPDQLSESNRTVDHCQEPYNMVVPPSPPPLPPVSPAVQNYFFEREKELNVFGVNPRSPTDRKLPFLHRLVQELTEKQIQSEIEEHRQYFRFKSLKSCTGFYPDESSTGPELKVPFYRPLRGAPEKSVKDEHPSPPPPLTDWTGSELLTSMSRSNRINRMLKNVITKAIAEKFRSSNFDGLLGGVNDPFYGTEPFRSLDGGATTTCLGQETVTKHHHNHHHHHHHHQRSHLLTALHLATTSASNSPDFESNMADSRSTSGSSDGEKKQTRGGVGGGGGAGGGGAEKMSTKKTRPKRGQYRKYNRQLLLEAVKAVQKGDMSVHRAGSFYGVPHSTLEYKVKERHLLRQKKAQDSARTAGESTEDNCTGSGTVPNAPSIGGGSGGGTTGSSSSSSSAGNSSSTKPIKYSKGPPPLVYGKDSPLLADPGSHRLTACPPYTFRYPHEGDRVLSPAPPGLSSIAPPSLPLPVGCFRGTLPIGFGWPPLMAGMFPVAAVGGAPPVPLFDAAQVPSFGFSMSASDLLKRLQQKVQANLDGGHDIPSTRDPVSALEPTDNRVSSLSPEINSDRSSSSSSSTCSIGSPQVAVS